MAGEKKEKKKKGGAGVLLLLLLLLLLLGLGVGFGLGGFGGLLPGGEGKEQAQQAEPQDDQTTAQQPAESKTEEQPQQEGEDPAKKEPYVIVVGENGITLDGAEMSIEALTAEVTGLPEGAELILKDEHALMADYQDVKAVLDAAGVTYSEEK